MRAGEQPREAQRKGLTLPGDGDDWDGKVSRESSIKQSGKL